MPRGQSRNARIEARIAPDALAVVKRPRNSRAAASATSLSPPPRRPPTGRSRRRTSSAFRSKTQQRFVDLLLNPPPLSPALERARGSPFPAHLGLELMVGEFLIEALGTSHDRAGFSCGVEALDRYFQKQATQDVRRRATACYVAREASGAKVAGYYYARGGRNSPGGDAAAELARRLPDYPFVPVARLGRLAVDLRYPAKLGSVLLWDAVQRAVRSRVCSVSAKERPGGNLLPSPRLRAFRRAAETTRPAAYEPHRQGMILDVSPPRRPRVKPCQGGADAVEVLAGHDVEGLAVGAAELEVGGGFGGRDDGEELPLGGEDVGPGAGPEPAAATIRPSVVTVMPSIPRPSRSRGSRGGGRRRPSSRDQARAAPGDPDRCRRRRGPCRRG